MGKMKDGGDRQEFASGAVREPSEGKGRYDLISPVFLLDLIREGAEPSPGSLKRLAIVMENGAKKYAPRNWEKGMPISRCWDSAFRHLQQFFMVEEDEDHAAHCLANIMFMYHLDYLYTHDDLADEFYDLNTAAYEGIEEEGPMEVVGVEVGLLAYAMTGKSSYLLAAADRLMDLMDCQKLE